MKVSTLIAILEKNKDQDLYFLNVAGTNKITNIKKQIVGDALFLEFGQSHDHKFISEFVSLKDGFSVRMRTEDEMEYYRKAKIREERQFNYYFEVGSKVMIDEDILLNMDIEKLSHLFGKVGIVKKCESAIHAFANGTSYYHVIEWETGEKTQDGDFEEGTEYDPQSYMPKNYVSTIYLKAANDK